MGVSIRNKLQCHGIEQSTGSIIISSVKFLYVTTHDIRVEILLKSVLYCALAGKTLQSCQSVAAKHNILDEVEQFRSFES